EALTMSRARRVCSTMPPGTGLPASSRPAVPATRITLPWRTAREYPNWNSYFVSVLYRKRSGLFGSWSGMDRRHLLDHRVRELLRADRGRVVAVRLEVVRDVLADRDHRGDRALEPITGVALADVLQHERAREHEGHRVHLVLAGVLRRRSVDRLEHRDAVLADVRAGRHAEPPGEAGDQVAHDVAVEVRQDEHVVELWLLDELHAHVVDDAVLELDVR